MRLVLAEPDPETKAGERTMDIALQGKEVLANFDLVREAGGPRRLLMREFNATPVNGRIVIALESTGSLPTVISGVEWIRQPE